MNKTELLNDISLKAKGVVLATNMVEEIGEVKRYLTDVFTTGEDADGAPIAQKRTINWYVLNEGGQNEAAYYGNRHWKNPEDKNVRGHGLGEIESIFQNSELRVRVRGVICKGIRANGGVVAKAFSQNANGVLDVFMAWVASNATIQANGGAASDSDLEYVVLTEAWSDVAAALT